MDRSPISVLQEYMQMAKKPLPVYTETPVAQGFHCLVTAGGKSAEAIGLSKKTAKEASAKKALNFFISNCPIESVELQIAPSTTPDPVFNWVGKLNQYCSQNNLPYPVYTDVVFNLTNFATHCTLLGVTSQGIGSNRKTAKQNAAKEMLTKVDTLPKQTKKEIELENNNNILEKYSKLTVCCKQSEVSCLSISDEAKLNFQKRINRSGIDLSEILENGSEEQLRTVIKDLNIKFDIMRLSNNPLVLYLKSENPTYTFIQQPKISQNGAICDLLSKLLKSAIYMSQ